MAFRHNKKRNTAFLFEMLLAEIVQCTISKEQEKKRSLTELFKRYFTKTILKEDLRIYRDIYDSKNNLGKDKAYRALAEAVSRFKKLNRKEVFNKQTQLISEVNKIDSSIFDTFIKDYRVLASINQYFTDHKLSINEKINLEDNIVSLIKEGEEAKKEQSVESVDNITYKIFLEKFNKKFSDLLPEQKELLKHYFLWETNNNSIDFKLFFTKQIKEGKKVLNEALDLPFMKSDEIMYEKTKQVLNKLEEFREREIKPQDLTEFMKIQQLVYELKEE